MIHEPHVNDVVFGRGNGVAFLPGNINFRRIIWNHRASYKAIDKDIRKNVAYDVMADVYRLDPPGRFLEKLPGGGYVEADEGKILEKCCQSLRDKKFKPPSIDKVTHNRKNVKISKPLGRNNKVTSTSPSQKQRYGRKNPSTRKSLTKSANALAKGSIAGANKGRASKTDAMQKIEMLSDISLQDLGDERSQGGTRPIKSSGERTVEVCRGARQIPKIASSFAHGSVRESNDVCNEMLFENDELLSGDPMFPKLEALDSMGSIKLDDYLDDDFLTSLNGDDFSVDDNMDECKTPLPTSLTNFYSDMWFKGERPVPVEKRDVGASPTTVVFTQELPGSDLSESGSVRKSLF